MAKDEYIAMLKVVTSGLSGTISNWHGHVDLETGLRPLLDQLHAAIRYMDSSSSLVVPHDEAAKVWRLIETIDSTAAGVDNSEALTQVSAVTGVVRNIICRTAGCFTATER
jgi:hypothetical protein